MSKKQTAFHGFKDETTQKIKKQTASSKPVITKAMREAGILSLEYCFKFVPDFYKGRLWLATIDARLVNGATEYQRPLKTSHVNKIIADYHFPSRGVALYCYDGEKGTVNVMDGNHRRTTDRIVGNNIYEVALWLNLPHKEESYTFGNVNALKLKCDKWIEFNSRLISGREVEIQIAALCKKYKLSTPLTAEGNSHPDLDNTTVLYDIYLKKGSIPFANKFLKILSGWAREKTQFLNGSARRVEFQRGLMDWLHKHEEMSAEAVIKAFCKSRITPCDITSMAGERQLRDKTERPTRRQYHEAFEAAIVHGKKPKPQQFDEDVLLLKKPVKQTKRYRKTG
jgi:hypothetical protein